MSDARKSVMYAGPTGEEHLMLSVRSLSCPACSEGSCLHVRLIVSPSDAQHDETTTERHYAHLDWETAAMIMTEVSQDLEAMASVAAAHHVKQDALF